MNNFPHTLFFLARERALFLTLLKRSVAERYRGSILGIFWSVLQPLLLLFVYGVVFLYVFKARLGIDGAPNVPAAYPLLLFTGIVLHQFFAETITMAPSLILNHPNYVKKVIFPLGLLVPVRLGGACVGMLVALLLALLGWALFVQPLPLTALLLPVLLIPFLLFTLGIGWALAAFGPYLRDLSLIMPMIATICLFFSTVFYPASHLPGVLAKLIYLNPLSYMVDTVRRTIFLGELPGLGMFLLYSIVSLAVYALGAWLFTKLARGFADVL